MSGYRNCFRTILYDGDFSNVVREERNFAAILYFLLLSNGENLRKFLRIAYKSQSPSREAPQHDPEGIFFEYAHLRDAWHAVGIDKASANENNQKKFAALMAAIETIGNSTIRDAKGSEITGLRAASISLAASLQPIYISAVDAKDFSNLNGLFVSNPSRAHIQSPQTWQARRIMGPSSGDQGLSSKEDLSLEERKLLVILGWCFNAKPDLVVHMDRETAICIEIKVESGEGMYCAVCPDGSKFRVSQGEVQKMIMALLFLDPMYVSVGPGQINGYAQVGWRDLFSLESEGPDRDKFDFTGAPVFVIQMIRRVLSLRPGAGRAAARRERAASSY